MVAHVKRIENSGGRRKHIRPMSEINVTPFVDVMLVLLVVFMVTAPLLTVGVPVDLPQTQAPPINEPKEPLVITVNRDAVIYVRGDKQLNYGRVLEVMSLVSTAGFRKVSLVAEAPKGPAAANRPGTSVRR